VTPAAYLLPFAIIFRSRAATAVDDADADPVRVRDEVLALGDQLDVVAGVDLGEDLGAGELARWANARLAVSSRRWRPGLVVGSAATVRRRPRRGGA